MKDSVLRFSNNMPVLVNDKAHGEYTPDFYEICEEAR